jgi:membrane-bound lytic murein transglycosylase B
MFDLKMAKLSALSLSRTTGEGGLCVSKGRVRAFFKRLLICSILASSLHPALTLAKPTKTTQATQGFSQFIANLWPDAQTAGVSRATFDAAFQGVTPDASIIKLTKGQAEFNKPVWEYLNSATSPDRIRRGAAKGSEWADTLSNVERRYGVDRKVILGIWGMETGYGANTGGIYVIRALATLAHAKYRDNFFRDELLVALKILEEGHIERQNMKGSWAGAMGQTQFMPSSFMKYAVDYNGGGAKDIWTSEQDALASTANYLKSFGWKQGLVWGLEVELPDGFDFKLADRKVKRSFAQWAGLGLKPAQDRGMPTGEAALFLPAGAKGAAFLITDNFNVIKKYNNSDSYALGVALLGDRIGGADPIKGSWPRGTRSLTKVESMEVQRKLAALGYPIEKFDGKLGENSRESIRNFQLKKGMVADGYPSVEVLKALRGR